MRYIFLIIGLLWASVAFSQNTIRERFLLVGSATSVESTVNDSTYIVNTLWYSDQTGNNYYADSIEVGDRLVDYYMKRYRVDSILSTTINTAQLRLVRTSEAASPGWPIGVVWVYEALPNYDLIPLPQSNAAGINPIQVSRAQRHNMAVIDSLLSGGSGLSLPLDSISFDTSYTTDPQRGTLIWNNDDETLDLGINGVVLQIGQEMLAHIKNQTGSTINNGTVVRYSGSVGASGRMNGDLMIADGTYPAYHTIGVTTEDIPNGEDGFATVFGVVRGINTSAYSAGDILYVSTTVAGALTDTVPEAPNPKIPIAVVLNSGNNGAIFVRPTILPELNDIADVEITSPVDSSILMYDSLNQKYIDVPYPSGSGGGTDDQTAAEVSVTPAGNLNSTDVQAALEEHQADINALAAGAADGVATAGVYDAINEEIDVTVAAPGSNFSIDVSALLDNTDSQTLSIDSTGRVFEVSISSSNSVTFEDTNTQLTEAQVVDIVRDTGFLTQVQIQNIVSDTADVLRQDITANAGLTLQDITDNGNSTTNSILIGTGSIPTQTKLRVAESGTSASTWRGRIVAGGDSVAFLMGEYNSKAWVGAHNQALTSWEDFYLNPDGESNLYLGNRDVGATKPIISLYNGRADAVKILGNVGIDTTPNTYQLLVSGTVAFPSISDGSSHTELVTRNDATGELGYVTNNISNWNTAYGWGDHSTAGYLTSEVDGSTTNELQTIDEVLTQGNSILANRSINVNGNQMQIGGTYAAMLARTFDVTLSSFDLSLNTADIITDTGEILLRHRLSGDVGADQDYMTLDATSLELAHRNNISLNSDSLIINAPTLTLDQNTTLQSGGFSMTNEMTGSSFYRINTSDAVVNIQPNFIDQTVDGLSGDTRILQGFGAISILRSTTGDTGYPDFILMDNDTLSLNHTEQINIDAPVIEINGEKMRTGGPLQVTAGATTVSINLGSLRSQVVQIDMTSASTASPITVTISNPISNGTYTLHWQNTDSGGHDLNLPANVLKADGTAFDGSTTITYDADDWFTCYYDGTNFYCK